MNLCETCFGCNMLELDDFEPVKKCVNYIKANDTYDIDFSKIKLTNREMQLLIILSDNRKKKFSDISKIMFGDENGIKNVNILKYRLCKKTGLTIECHRSYGYSLKNILNIC